MTLEDFQQLVKETCYGPDGMLDREYLKHLYHRHAPSLPPESRWAAYGQLVYNPSKDLRLKWGQDMTGGILGVDDV